jgi:hypothetical protein
MTPLFFFAGMFGAFSVVIWFNVRTWQLVRLIQAQYGQGKEAWDFWSDRSLQLTFVLRPHLLMDGTETSEVLHAKQALIDHRLKMWKSLSLALALFVAGMIGAVTIPAILH